MIFKWSDFNSLKKGCTSKIRLYLPSILLLYMTDILLLNYLCLFGDVNSNRTPGDTPAAAHTTVGGKLVAPIRQLVGQPLAVTRHGSGADATTEDVRKIAGKAGIPFSDPLSSSASQIGVIFNGSAEACGADQSAVATGEATNANPVPLRMLRPALQGFL
jgi:hypothetical protein